MIKISPSVLACDFSRLGDEAAAMERAGADLLHLDVMDGHFVPNISFGAPVIKALRPGTALPFDTHLMISRPLRYLHDFAGAGCDLLSFHVECSDPVGETIDGIVALAMKPGLVLKPATPAEAVLPHLDRLAMVLVMTVEPGFGGQRFLPDMLPKITTIRRAADERGLALDIEVDGGIDEETAPLAVKAGANVLVAGSSLFGAADYAAAVDRLRTAAQRGIYAK